MKITIDPIEGIFIEDNGQKKFITEEDLKRIVSANNIVETDILPLNCVYFIKTENGYAAMLKLNAQANVRYNYRNQVYEIPYPDILFGFTVKNNRHVYSFCVALHPNDVNNLSETTPIYHFPFANVYQDLHICWGTVRMPEINKPKELLGLTQMFLGARFNDDLFNTLHFGRGKDYFEDLERRTSYPADWLQRSSGTTFRNLIRLLKANL